MEAHHEGFGDQLAGCAGARRSAPAPPRRRARSAFRTARACRPRARGSSRARAIRWAADCRSPRSRDRRATPRRSRRPGRCRASAAAPAPWRGRARRSRRCATLAVLHRRNHLLDADLGDAEHAPVNLSRHRAPPHRRSFSPPPASGPSPSPPATRPSAGLALQHPAGIFGLQRADLVERRDLLGA